MKYASMLRQLLQRQGGGAIHVWLLNTGFCGGPCGSGAGARIPLAHTKAVVAAIHSGALAAAPYATLPVFNLQMPTSVDAPGVRSELLHPGACWADQEAYGQQLRRLAALFAANFRQFEDGGGHVPPGETAAIGAAGPAPDQ